MARVGPKDVALAQVFKSKALTVTNNGLTVGSNVQSFESARANVRVTSGKWYYEATLQSSDLMQIGWATESWKGNPSSGDGCGDDAHSWAYDGQRCSSWHAGNSSSYGSRWSSGDVIGCGVDITEGVVRFWRNGTDLGIAYRGINAATGLYPAVSISKNQKLTFNFGKTKLAHSPAGFSPLYSDVDEAAVARLADLFDKYKMIGKSLSQSSDADVIKGTGTLQLGEDLGVTEDTDPLLLVLAYKLNAPHLWEFSRDEWNGLARHNVTTLQAIGEKTRGWQRELLNPSGNRQEFKRFYLFVFDYLRETKKILEAEEAKMVWNMILKPVWPMLPKWLEFFDSTNSKSVSRDTWQQLAEFATQYPTSVTSYDEDSSWPVAIDEFVGWLKK